MLANHAAAVLLGAAVRKVFPHNTYLGSGVDEKGFFAHFRDSAPFQKEYFSLLERQMKEYASLPLESKEMLGGNAADFFRHKGEEELAETVPEGLVEVVSVGPYVDLCPGPMKGAGFYALVDFAQEKGEVCIRGVAFETQKELKNFLKLYRDYFKNCAEHYKKELALFDAPFWHEGGLQLQALLKEKGHKFLLERGFSEMAGGDPKDYFNRFGKGKLSTWDGLGDCSFSFEKDSLISCLQILREWIKIFDFEAKWVLHAQRAKSMAKALKELDIRYETGSGDKAGLTVYLADGLGRFCPGPSLERRGEAVSFSLMGNREKFIDLLLEKVKGELPFNLCPEQVRLLPVGEVDKEKVEQVLKGLALRYRVDGSDRPLKEKMHRALQVKVPCVIVFGKQEEKTGNVQLRSESESQNRTLTIEQMKNFLSERVLESQ